MQNLAEYIIRPARRVYDIEILGPQHFTIDQIHLGQRVDFEVLNRRYKKLKCSLFHHKVQEGVQTPLIVFCHGNSGNRTYSYEIVFRMMKANFSVLTFDFAGCGLSEGKYVFQGYFEQFDIEDVLEEALKRFPFIDQQKIGIWGRSMGAIAALLFTSHNHSASFIILDSPIKDFSGIINEYMNRVKIIPNVIAKYVLSNLRKRIMKMTSFDITELKPIEIISSCKTPALFHHARDDKVVLPQNSKDLFQAYPASKQYLETEGGHNSVRKEDFYDEVLKFIQKTLAKKKDIKEMMRSRNTSTIQPSKNEGELDNINLNDSDSGIESEELEKIIEKTESDCQSVKEEHEESGENPYVDERNIEESVTESIDEEVEEKDMEKVLREFFAENGHGYDDEELGQILGENRQDYEYDDEHKNEDYVRERERSFNEDEQQQQQQEVNEEPAFWEEVEISANMEGDNSDLTMTKNQNISKNKGYLVMNEKKDLFSHNSSPDSPQKDMSPELSSIMSERNMSQEVKSFQLFRWKTPARNSFLQDTQPTFVFPFQEYGK